MLFPVDPIFLLLLPLSPLLLLFFFHGRRRRPTNLPPSPPKLPILGNLHQLTSLPHRSLHSLFLTHGPLLLLHLGQIPTLVVSTPDLAREVLKTQDHVFADRPSSKPARLIMYGQKNVSFAFYGDHWRNVKKISTVHLLSSKKIQSFRAVREQEVAAMVDKIKDGILKGEAVELSELLYEFANGVIIRAVTGEGRTTARRFKELVDEATALLRGVQVEDAFPSLWWIGWLTGTDANLKKLFHKWDLFLNGLVDGHRRGGGDFIDVLLSLHKKNSAVGTSEDFVLTKNDIKTLAMDMNAAGTDTTYVVLEWAMAELIKNPTKMAKAKEEIGNIVEEKPIITEDDINQLTYLKAIIKEVLRLHPPAPLLLPHESMEETTIHGYTIPKKTRLLVNVWALGRDPEWWDSPEEFSPERFLDSGVDFKGQDFQLLPFGSGRRMCPGVQFAAATMEVALANLVYLFEWRLADGRKGEELDMDEAPGITIRRASPLRVVAKPCSSLAYGV